MLSANRSSNDDLPTPEIRKHWMKSLHEKLHIINPCLVFKTWCRSDKFSSRWTECTFFFAGEYMHLLISGMKHNLDRFPWCITHLFFIRLICITNRSKPNRDKQLNQAHRTLNRLQCNDNTLDPIKNGYAVA